MLIEKTRYENIDLVDCPYRDNGARLDPRSGRSLPCNAAVSGREYKTKGPSDGSFASILAKSFHAPI